MLYGASFNPYYYICKPNANLSYYIMNKTITFNELRKIKDSLPSGSMQRIADELGLSVETIRNFFGGHNFINGQSVGIHLEPGPDGGLVMLDDTTVLDKALSILQENSFIE